MNWKQSSSPAALGEAPAVPEEVVDRETLAQWLVATCKTFGAKLSTSHQVAGKVIEQLEKDDVTHALQPNAAPQEQDARAVAAEQSAPDGTAPAVAAPSRVLSWLDRYCPSCGGKDTGTNNDDGTYYCDRCGAEWRRV